MNAQQERLVRALKAADAAGDVDGASKLAQALRSSQQQPAQAERPYNATDDMSGTDRLLAGAGKAFVDAGRGVQQLSTGIGNAVGLGRLMPDSFGDAEVERQRQGIADSRERDAALMDTTGGKVGNFAGNMALAAPTAAIPGANTVTGAGAIGAGLGLIQPATSGQERLINTGMGAGLGAGGQYLGGKMLGAADDALRNRAAAASQRQSQNAVRDQTLKGALDEGYVVPPSTTNPTAMNTALESISGKAATQSAAAAKNQRVTNSLVKRDLGLADDAPLTRDTLKSVRQKAGVAYRDIENAGNIVADQQYLDDLVDLVGGNSNVSKNFPGAKVSADQSVVDLADSLLQGDFTAKAALEYSKRLRSQSKDNFRSAYASGGSPEKLELARAQWDAAGALEDVIERNLQSRGQGDLAENFRKARVTIAKSHSAEAALNEGTGNIVASKLVNQLRKGKPMSGGFDTVAKFGSVAPKAVAEPTQSGGVSALSAALAAGGVGLGQPGIVALPVARLLTRHALLSKRLQARRALPNYTPNRAGTAALQSARGLGRIAAPAGMSAYATEQ
jgi:hypothetical protein